MADTDLLDGHADIFIKKDRVDDVPAIKTTFRWHIVHVIRIVDRVILSGIIGISHKRRTVGLFSGYAVFRSRKAPGAAKIILCSRSADGRIFLITIQVNLQLSLSPPITFQGCKGKIGANVMSFSFYAVQDRIVLLKLRQALPSPLCMEVGHILGNLVVERIIDLVEKCRYLRFMLILQRNAGFFPERHLKITVEASGRIYHNRERIYHTAPCKTTAEKISQRAFHGRLLFIVPINPQNQVAQHIIILFRTVCNRHPDMLNDTRSFHLRQHSRLSRRDLLHTGRTFSARTKASCCHSALSFFSPRIFLIDTAAFSFFLKHK